jgi:restriction endonuclease S subunit
VTDFFVRLFSSSSASILSGIDAKIAAEEKVLEKCEKVKKGLMERMLEEKK